MTHGDFYALDKETQVAVRTVVDIAKWTHVAADREYGDKRIHAYPLQRTPGLICWGVIAPGHKCLASGVM